MAPKYKLYYFNARGRAELARLIMAQAGVEFEDIRIEKDKWPEYKSKMPFGQLPVLEVDGKQLAQSFAICRYLAKTYGLIPKDSFDEALADQVGCACLDIIDILSPYIRESNPEKKKELGAKFVTQTLPPYLDYVEKFIKAHGKGFLIGDQLTWADLAVAGGLHSLVTKIPGGLDEHPLLKALLDKVMNLPNIKAWIAKRPVTEH